MKKQHGKYNHILNKKQPKGNKYSPSRTCSEFNCLNTCSAISALTLNQDGPQTRPTSDCPGNVESACSLSGTYVNGGSCGTLKTGTMLVAFTNGKLFVNGENAEYDDQYL
jgi:hypothetical protein